ncbi:MAG: hypothetical protein Q7K43_01990, partial [Candidatus Woesearchaeota archaeon]|nr:hypothetical protein [Candidatus Woesearchaeota archaeon]
DPEKFDLDRQLGEAERSRSEKSSAVRIANYLLQAPQLIENTEYDAYSRRHKAPSFSFPGKRKELTWALDAIINSKPTHVQIQKRQELCAFLAQHARNPKSPVIEHIEQVLVTYKETDDSFEHSSPLRCPTQEFSVLVSSLEALASTLTNTLAQPFSEDITQLLGKHKIAKSARFFSKEKGRVLLSPKYAVENDSWSGSGSVFKGWETKLIRLDDDTSLVDLGLWKWEQYPYPLFPQHKKEMFSLFKAIAGPLYLLGLLYWHAVVDREREKHNLPSCMPTITEKQEFMIQNAHPLGVDHSQYAGAPIGAVAVDFQYTPKQNKVVIGGAHSGGKTILLETIDLYHEYGRTGLPLPCTKAVIPLNAVLKRSYTKPKHDGRGSLESELVDIMTTANTLGANDVYLCDELLDTTRPEIGNSLQIPVLAKLGERPGVVIVVCHRIKDVPDSLNYRFIHPELVEREIDELVLEREVGRHCYWRGTGKRVMKLFPTHKFVEGKPDPALTALHAKQMWAWEKE